MAFLRYWFDEEGRGQSVPAQKSFMNKKKTYAIYFCRKKKVFKHQEYRSCNINSVKINNDAL